ncbi:hypothetical protein RchiOBHm_Chr4g0401321 [Rosa chinensis]|uniref:Uncharacterized protein n=1 Tax=Rosa chinensis TaxID=74649 RepID=A0A2P6QT18_ROSCH|nr:hypothetical protein RchiOBHm_Chr4g0401321 [Rosa chinensis]
MIDLPLSHLNPRVSICLLMNHASQGCITNFTSPKTPSPTLIMVFEARFSSFKKSDSSNNPDGSTNTPDHMASTPQVDLIRRNPNPQSKTIPKPRVQASVVAAEGFWLGIGV